MARVWRFFSCESGLEWLALPRDDFREGRFAGFELSSSYVALPFVSLDAPGAILSLLALRGAASGCVRRFVVSAVFEGVAPRGVAMFFARASAPRRALALVAFFAPCDFFALGFVPVVVLSLVAMRSSARSHVQRAGLATGKWSLK